jgi:hypothetical protein
MNCVVEDLRFEKRVNCSHYLFGKTGVEERVNLQLSMAVMQSLITGKQGRRVLFEI